MNNWKQNITIGFFVIIALAFTFGACDISFNPDPNPVLIRFHTGGTSGDYYAFGSAFASVLNDALNGVRITVHTPVFYPSGPSGAARPNILTIEAGNAEMALAENGIINHAWNGTDDGTWNWIEQYQNFRAIGTLFTETSVEEKPRATLIVASSLSNYTIYQITKGLFENRAQIAALNAKGIEIDVYEAVVGLGDIPLHPGAKSYFKEVGVLP